MHMLKRPGMVLLRRVRNENHLGADVSQPQPIGGPGNTDHETSVSVRGPETSGLRGTLEHWPTTPDMDTCGLIAPLWR